MDVTSKVIHRIWMGPNPMPDEYKEYGRKWEDLNPGWQVHDWTQEELENDGIINRNVWDDLAVPLSSSHVIHEVALATQRADVSDYELVYKFGGLYVNTDIEPVKPLSVMFDNNPQLYTMAGAGWEVPGQWVVNAVLWAPERKMPFWGKVVDELPKRYYSNPGGYMNGTTGPHLITDVYNRNPGELHVFDRDTFNPYGFVDVPVGGVLEYDVDKLPSITVGVHKWGHRTNGRPQTSSWIPPN